jgi:K+-transporting ATPase A subunit
VGLAGSSSKALNTPPLIGVVRVGAEKQWGKNVRKPCLWMFVLHNTSETVAPNTSSSSRLFYTYSLTQGSKKQGWLLFLCPEAIFSKTSIWAYIYYQRVSSESNSQTMQSPKETAGKECTRTWSWTHSFSAVELTHSCKSSAHNSFSPIPFS